MDTESHCNCQRCGNPLAFPLDLHNQEIACPHCGRTTTLIAVAARATQVRAMRAGGTDNASLIRAGYLCAFLLPIIGFFIGVYLLATTEKGHGAAQMGISLFFGFLWLAIISSA